MRFQYSFLSIFLLLLFLPGRKAKYKSGSNKLEIFFLLSLSIYTFFSSYIYLYWSFLIVTGQRRRGSTNSISNDVRSSFAVNNIDCEAHTSVRKVRNCPQDDGYCYVYYFLYSSSRHLTSHIVCNCPQANSSLSLSLSFCQCYL